MQTSWNKYQSLHKLVGPDLGFSLDPSALHFFYPEHKQKIILFTIVHFQVAILYLLPRLPYNGLLFILPSVHVFFRYGMVLKKSLRAGLPFHQEKQPCKSSYPGVMEPIRDIQMTFQPKHHQKLFNKVHTKI